MGSTNSTEVLQTNLEPCQDKALQFTDHDLVELDDSSADSNVDDTTLNMSTIHIGPRHEITVLYL